MYIRNQENIQSFLNITKYLVQLLQNIIPNIGKALYSVIKVDKVFNTSYINSRRPPPHTRQRLFTNLAVIKPNEVKKMSQINLFKIQEGKEATFVTFVEGQYETICEKTIAPFHFKLLWQERLEKKDVNCELNPKSWTV